MTCKETEAKRLYSYLTAIGLATAGCYISLIIWLALHSPEVLNHEDKVVALMMLIVLPGRLLLERLFSYLGTSERQRIRISGMLFVGVLVSLYATKGAPTYLAATIEFSVTFPWAAGVYLVLDALNMKTISLWQRLKRSSVLKT